MAERTELGNLLNKIVGLYEWNWVGTIGTHNACSAGSGAVPQLVLPLSTDSITQFRKFRYYVVSLHQRLGFRCAIIPGMGTAVQQEPSSLPRPNESALIEIVEQALHASPTECLFFRELRVGTGRRNGGTQRLDAFALNTLPHTAMKRVCYEVKRSWGDFLTELKHPLRAPDGDALREWVLFCDARRSRHRRRDRHAGSLILITSVGTRCTS